MKIDKRTGVIDFGNGLIVDPRETLTEFDRKVPRELLKRVGKVEDATFYWFENMFISNLAIKLNMRIFFKPGEKLRSIAIEKEPTPEELEDDSLWYVEKHQELLKEYNIILEKLLGSKQAGSEIYKYDWGAAGASIDTRTPSSGITIQYRQDNN